MRGELSEKTLTVASHECRAIFNRGSGIPVVFLHGYSYTAESWQRTGITDLLIGKNVPFLALDMPYGAHSHCRPHSRSVEINIKVIEEAVQTFFPSAVPVLVGASLGSHIALQFASRYPVKGLLLVGAVRVLEDTLVQAYSRFEFPVRLIVGSEDNIASSEDLRTLAGMLPDGKLTVFDGVGHSAYLGDPERFRHELLELYALSER
jgi:abhydrolase domain-containing protein 14